MVLSWLGKNKSTYNHSIDSANGLKQVGAAQYRIP